MQKSRKIAVFLNDSFHFLRDHADILAFAVIFIIITISSIPPLLSGDRLNFNDDFFQYAARHEAVRKGIIEYHTFPLRSFWFGGGYPTLGDPEDPSLNPLVLLTVLFGTVTGLKVITFAALLIGGLSTYALARYILGYTRWGALFSGLAFGMSLFIPLRIQDGNPNEVYSAFLPLCMLLIGFACRGRKAALLILPFVLYTMISDGKYNALMAYLYLGILCFLDIIPIFNTYGAQKPPGKINIQPIKVILIALGIAFLIGMMRILPAIDLINSKGGFGRIDLFFSPKTYSPESVPAYTYQQLWQESLGWKGIYGLVTVGWLPVALSIAAFYIFRRRSFPWGVNLVLFGWLILAHNAPVDLLKLLWNLPVFNALYRPYKYFSFEIAFTVAVVSGQFFWLLVKLRPRWLEHVFAIILVIAGMWFLYPKVTKIQSETYTYGASYEPPVSQDEFFSIQGQNLVRNRKEPPHSVTYMNIIRNIGTVDWHTGIPIDENAVPKYFVDSKNNYIPNTKYRGEAFFLEPQNSAKAIFRPNSMIIQVSVQQPGTLIVNQNYHKGWRTNRGELFAKDGLIALQLQEIGSYNVIMRYIPGSFYAGLAISLFTFAGIIFVIWAYVTGHLVGWSQSSVPIFRHTGKVILWIIEAKVYE